MIKRLLAATALCIFITTTAFSQKSSSASQTISLHLQPSIEITTLGSQKVDLFFANTANYANGVQSTAQEFKVRSNHAFKVSVRTDANNFAYSGNIIPAPVMPVNNNLFLSVSSNNTGGTSASGFNNTFATIGYTSKDILMNCMNGADKRFSVNYKASPDYNYPKGTYSIGVVYTGTQP